MNDTLINYTDPVFNHEQTSACNLLLLIDAETFSLAITNQEKLLVWAQQCPLQELTQPNQLHALLTAPYHQVITGLCATGFTLIPEPLYDGHDVSAIARYLDVQPHETVLAQPLDHDNRVIFKTTENLMMAIARFDIQKALFAPSGWIQAIAGSNPSGYNLYININVNSFDLVYFRQGKVLLFNTYEITHEDELTYYTLFTVKQLKLDPGTLSVFLSGMTEMDEQYFSRLSTFFSRVILSPINVLNIPQLLPAHQLLSLTALSLCASLVDA
ncbi:DUF3822 family protein [Mucilaginibacter robiniae]|uniref:DUF3822 family protein n=1 Tax=Mucilaginibacter robiniae TaxID=2728022 RepID=A0A7L5DXU5_9SPHI|nr:DUF3822 family protein [Mucilaginibacter robiniae]QJD95028.1 DUF3822 family protein [Mucilaginibacter robiniae]